MSGEPTVPWRPPTTSRTFGARLAAQLDRVRREVGPDAFDLYLLGLLVIDGRGRIPKVALPAMNAVLDNGEVRVGYDRLSDGAVRVWYREVAS